MKTITLFALFFFGGIALSFAQNLNAYKYIEVPVKYGFQDEENEYLLNGLTAFLFEKQGFKVLYEEEIPENTDPCEILKANVVDESSFFRTKVKVTLEDCYDNIVFTSELGKSRYKEYKKSFQDALRNAFASVEKLDYSYEGPSEEKASVGFRVKKVEAPELSENTEKTVEQDDTANLAGKTPSSGGGDTPTIRNFINGNTAYRLEETPAGYALFRAQEKEKFATLMKSGGGKSFIYASGKLQGAAYFDETGNLVVEYINPETGQLVSVEYKFQN